MAVEVRNLRIDQGATYTLDFTWYADDPANPGQPDLNNPIPLTGATARMQIRKKQGEQVLLEATSGDGITIDGPAGRVTAVLVPAKTNMLSYKSCRYDLEVEFSPTEVYRLLEGSVTVKANITQDAGEPVLQ